MAQKRINQKKIIASYSRSLDARLSTYRMFLFGSAARGTQTKDSDLDILVVSRDFVNMPFMSRLELLNRLRTIDARMIPMDIIGVTPSEFSSFKKHESPNLRAIYRESKRV